MTSPLGLYYEGPSIYMPIMDIQIRKVCPSWTYLPLPCRSLHG